MPSHSEPGKHLRYERVTGEPRGSEPFEHFEPLFGEIGEGVSPAVGGGAGCSWRQLNAEDSRSVGESERKKQARQLVAVGP